MNILITRHDKIGDFITILPMLQVLKKYGKYTIFVLVSKVNYDLAVSIEYIDDVILYTEDSLKLIQEINTKKINTSISCYIDARLSMVLFFSNIKYRISPATKIIQFFFNRRLRQRRSESRKTEWEYNLDLISLLNPKVSLNFDRPLLKINKTHTQDKRRVIAFHPGSGGSSEGNIMLDDYLILAKNISEKKNIRIVFTFGPDDQQSMAYIKKKIKFNAEIIESTKSLVDFCSLINTFNLFISTSTGPMHLAGALNIKTLSFFGNTLFSSSKRWAPLNDKENQINFDIPINYDRSFYEEIERTLCNIVDNL